MADKDSAQERAWEEWMGEDDEVLAAWCRYYTLTEEMDRTMPGRWSDRDPGTWIVDPEYRAASVRFAATVAKDIGLVVGPNSANLQQVALRMGYDEQRRFLENRGAPLPPPRPAMSDKDSAQEVRVPLTASSACKWCAGTGRRNVRRLVSEICLCVQATPTPEVGDE